jgi:hypothetical protein
MGEDENTSWEYKHDDPSGTEQPEGDSAVEQSGSAEANIAQKPIHAARGFSWEGPEYLEHDRSAGWYGLLGLAILIIAAALYFLTKDYFAIGATIIAGIIAGVYAGRKPNQVTYELTNKGLKMGQKFYAYGTFRSFSLYREGQLSSVNFIPIKRVMPPIAAYFNPKDEQKIIESIGDHLPYDQHKLDTIDRLTRRLRF